jgi:hypothetical protein
MSEPVRERARKNWSVGKRSGGVKYFVVELTNIERGYILP